LSKHIKINEAGRRGSSEGHEGRSRSGMFMCGRSKCSATGSNVPEDESNYQHGAGAFLDGLKRDWGYGHVKDLICDRLEMLERLPWMEGASCSYWSTRLGGSNRLSQQVVQDSKYSNMHSNFKRKSTIYEGQTISNSIT